MKRCFNKEADSLATLAIESRRSRIVLNSRLRFFPNFIKLCFDGGKRGNQASCGWIVWVAEALDEDKEPIWHRLIECSLLVGTHDATYMEFVDSFVAEMCGLCEVVFCFGCIYCIWSCCF